MKLYVAGPMRGIPHFNFPLFHAATGRLRAAGHQVFNPAERDIAATGVDISADNPTGSNEQAEANHGFNLREALKDDLEFVCLHADGVVMLPGWVNSKGANAEVATAIALNLRLFHYTEADPLVEVSKADRPITAFAEAS
ncbi:MAG: hypothetical protein CFE29_03060 [Bradyrhizobiaceae bacterium PARB1]|jgi:Domain of unknown function (DUF4406)|nr:MAG: hypothetical protein CFE29_03060 [Bradyrhizobiaceae bacterium PARB1]